MVGADAERREGGDKTTRAYILNSTRPDKDLHATLGETFLLAYWVGRVGPRLVGH